MTQINMSSRWTARIKVEDREACFKRLRKRWLGGSKETDTGQNTGDPRVMESKEYNRKIASVDKAEREEDLKLDQFYLGFRPTVDTALIPLCNTRFIKGHKPSNHIHARIKSHVYTTE